MEITKIVVSSGEENRACAQNDTAKVAYAIFLSHFREFVTRGREKTEI